MNIEIKAEPLFWETGQAAGQNELLTPSPKFLATVLVAMQATAQVAILATVQVAILATVRVAMPAAVQATVRRVAAQAAVLVAVRRPGYGVVLISLPDKS